MTAKAGNVGGLHLSLEGNVGLCVEEVAVDEGRRSVWR
jgi:hypothetical protein